MTLTEVSYYTRRFMPVAILGVLLLLIFYYSIKLFFIYLDSTKVSVLYTNPVFGNLPPPQVTNAPKSTQFTFTLDTIEGRPTTSTEAAKVFLLPQTPTNLRFKERSYLMAKTLGFDTEVTTHTREGTLFKFQDERRLFTVDITNFNFTYQYDFKLNPSVFQDVQPPDPENAVSIASNFLTKLDRYPPELAQGKTNNVYFNYDTTTSTLSPVNDPKLANVVEVDFYRPDIDGLPIVTPTYFNSQNYVMLIFNGKDYIPLRAQVKFFEKSTAQVGTYPLISGDTAYQDKLQKGAGMVISSTPGQTTVKIKKMFVGYLDPDTYQQYLQPVYIFLGDNNFVAYVPAVSDQYLSDK